MLKEVILSFYSTMVKHIWKVVSSSGDTESHKEIHKAPQYGRDRDMLEHVQQRSTKGLEPLM